MLTLEAGVECPPPEEEEEEEEEDWPPLERVAAAVRLLMAAITLDPLTGRWVGDGEGEVEEEEEAALATEFPTVTDDEDVPV